MFVWNHRRLNKHKKQLEYKFSIFIWKKRQNEIEKQMNKVDEDKKSNINTFPNNIFSFSQVLFHSLCSSELAFTSSLWSTGHTHTHTPPKKITVTA